MFRKLIIAVCVISATVAHAQSTSGWSIVTTDGGTNLWRDGTQLDVSSYVTNMNATALKTPYCKYHYTNSITLPSANTWTNMPFNFTPADENSFGFSLSNDTYTITTEFDGLIQINGCVRSKWTGIDNTAADTASRIVYSGDNWATTNEARCLQSYWSRARKTDDYQTAAYAGSLYVTNGLQIRLQVQVSNTDMELGQSPIFDSPLAVTFNAWAVGE